MMRNYTTEVIRIRTSLLQGLVLQHVSSCIDPPYVLDRANTSATGSTYWAASPRATCAAIRWRWAELRETIVLLDPNLIETNLLLVQPNGLEEPRLRTLLYLGDYIETLPWRTPVRRLLIASRH